MSKKTKRLDAIKLIISSREIGSQEELLLALKEKDIVITQATLSRDLKQLNVAKAANVKGKYVYVLPNDILYKRPGEHIYKDMPRSNGFISLNFSGNLAVIRTRPGYASSMAYDIDNMEGSPILGTIAGDDTILLVLHEETSRGEMVRFLEQMIPEISGYK